MSNITLTIPNDDSVALYHFGKSLIGMASAIDGAPDWVVITTQEYDRLKQLEELSQAQHIKVNIDSSDIEQLREALKKVEPTGLIQTDVIVDTTAQQVESLAAPTSDLPIITVNPTCHVLSNDELQERGFDSTGTPWDERIHSTSKALNADGTWRLRRKPKDMDEEEWAAFVESVKGELSYAMESFDEQVIMEEDSLQRPLCDIDPAHETAEPPVTPPGDDYHTDEQTVAGIPPLPVPPPVVVAPPVTEWDFPRLMTFLTERHGKIDVATVNTLLAQDGMLSVQELNAHPDKIGPFVARVKAHLGE